MSAAQSTPVIRIDGSVTQPRSFWNQALRNLWSDRMSMVAIFLLLALTLLCAFGPTLVERYLGLDPTSTDILAKYDPPFSPAHPLGTDNLGRDQLARLLAGGQISLSVAYLASLFSILIGVSLGIVAGYYGGVLDDIFTWFVTTLTSIPSLFLLLIASSIWSPSPPVLIVILAALNWVDTARLVRGEVFSLRESDFVLAARSIGASPRRIMAAHLLPNLLPLVIVNLTINAGVLILIESGISFLGLGIQPPTPSWGNMLTDSRTFFVKGVHLVILPGLLISLAVIGFYLIGDGLRDALDPRSVRAVKRKKSGRGRAVPL